MSSTKVLAIVLSDAAKELLAKVVQKDMIESIDSDEKFFETYESLNDGSYGAVICEARQAPEFASEVGQVIRNQCPQTPCFCMTFETNIFQPKIFKKNGYNDAFILPLDKQRLLDSLAQSLSPAALSKRLYKRVVATDLKTDSQVGFSTFIYLPLNKKHVALVAKGEKFTQKKADKLKERGVGNLFVDQKDTQAFYEYVATQFNAQDKTMSATERQEKFQDSVRDVFVNLFDQRAEDSFESGRDLLDSCRKIVSTYITRDAKADWFTKILHNLGGQSLEYSHSADVSTFAAMLALGLGNKNVEDLAVAGFLHDVALAQFPEEHDYGINPAWNEEIKSTYVAHPQNSLNTVKSRKMIVSPVVEKAILQHHEKWDGSGFPKGLQGDRISEEAQILSLADQIVYLYICEPGRPPYAAHEALDIIAKRNAISPAIISQVKKFIKP